MERNEPYGLMSETEMEDYEAHLKRINNAALQYWRAYDTQLTLILYVTPQQAS